MSTLQIFQESLLTTPVCNPFGGMGLTGGIVDIGGLFDCLVGIYDGVADDTILDKYSEIRRQKYNEIVNPISTQNILRLFDQDPDKALENDKFLQLLKRAETDDDFSRELQDGINGLKHDFTQYYHKSSGTTGENSARNGYPARDVPLQAAAAVGGAD